MYHPVSKISSGQIVCPKHRIPLTELRRLRLNDGREILVSPCPKCGCLYTNDYAPLNVPNGEFHVGDKVVLWSGLRVQIQKNGKPKIKPVKPVLQNKPVNIIRSKKELSAFRDMTSAKNILYLSNKRMYRVIGYFVAENQQFYCLPDRLDIEGLGNADLSQIKVNDPHNYLNTTKSGRTYLKARKEWEARAKRLAEEQAKAKEARLKKQKELIQNAYPGLYYTLPLLDEPHEEYCPFCHTKLEHVRAANIVLYVQRKPQKSIYFIVTGCSRCNLPLATHKDLERIRAHTKGRIVKILYASRFSQASAVIAEGQKKVMEIPAYIPPATEAQSILPFAPKTWARELPDLSRISQSRKVLVFARKCTCATCRETFKQDTIVARTATVFTASGIPVKINVQFCMGCGQYFLSLRSFYAYKKMYGPLDFQFILDEVSPEVLDWDKFAADSVLSQNGYSVKAGVSAAQRQRVLAYLLDNHIAEKHEIIALLSQFIQLQKNRLPEACERWKEDLAFVNQYKIDEQEKAGFKKLVQGGRLTQKE